MWSYFIFSSCCGEVPLADFQRKRVSNHSRWPPGDSVSKERTGDQNSILELIQSCLKTYFSIMNQTKLEA